MADFDWKAEAVPGYKPVRETSILHKIVDVHWPSGTFFFGATWTFVAVYSAELIDAEGAPPAAFCSPIIGPFQTNRHADTWSPAGLSWQLVARTADLGLVVGDPGPPPDLSFGDDIVMASVQVLPGAIGNPSSLTPTSSGVMEFLLYNKLAPRGCYGVDNIFAHFTVEGTPYSFSGQTFRPFSMTVPATAIFNGQTVPCSGSAVGWGGGGFGPQATIEGPVSTVVVRAAYRLGPPV